MEGTITQLGLKNYLVNTKKQRNSFFSHSYQNYYNYAKDVRKITFQASVDFGKRVSFRFDQNGRYGDLITNMVLQVNLPSVADLSIAGYSVGYTNGIGNALIKEVQLKIGGNIIDTQTGEWMDIWSKLSIPAGKQSAYNTMIKRFPTQSATNFKGGTVFIPFLFWFCQNVNANTKDNTGMCLPLIAMRNTDIELIVEFRPIRDLLIYTTAPGDPPVSLPENTLAGLSITESQLLVDYVILEPEERVKYLEAKRQMYLITQTQYHTFSILGNSSALNISMRNYRYPITELLWVMRSNDHITEKDYFNYTDRTYDDPSARVYYTKAKLTFDGRDRIPELGSDYFTQVEPFKVHDSIPDNNPISTMSFALEPENFAQPSGSCNFSGLHDPRFTFTMRPGSDIPGGSLPDGELTIFAINYNVMQVDDKGNVWLLHNLAKDTPGSLPDPNAVRYVAECSLTGMESKRMKQIIAKINELNLFTDPRLVETGLANVVNRYAQPRLAKVGPNDQDVVMPLLDGIYAEVENVGRRIRELQQAGKLVQNKEDRVVDIGGMRVRLDNFPEFLDTIAAKYERRD